jgi:uncharacterized protein (TIGR03437 family)
VTQALGGSRALLLCSCLLLAISVASADSDGVIATLAGVTRVNSAPERGYAGDDGPARKALLALADLQNECDPNRFEQISHIALDPSGALYVADTANQRIRRIASSGIITTFAGIGERLPVDSRTCVPTVSAIGDGASAALARLFHPTGIAWHPNGALILADQGNNRIRQISSSGIITTIAGNGLHAFYAPQIPATSSGLDWPTAVAVDAAGVIYFSELHSGRVARIGPDGRLATVAGSGIPGFNGDAGPATNIRLSNPTGIALDSNGALYIADQGNHRIRKVTPDGSLTTIAGGAAGFAGDGGAATAARLDRPADVKLDGCGNLFVADMNNHRVRRIDPSGVITTVAGDGVPLRGSDGVPAGTSSLSLPSGLVVDSAGDVFVVDWGNYLVRRITFRALPVITSNGVLNSASLAPGPISPGSLFSIFGSNLATSSIDDSVSVRVNGVLAPPTYISPGQINAQLPYATPAGEISFEVSTPAGSSPPEYASVANAAIGIFVYSGTARAICLNQDNSLNGAANPEARGRVLTVFLTGIGRVTPEIASGESAPLDRLHKAVASASATLGGIDAQIQFLGLTPGFVGLAQANVLIPDAVSPGAEVPLVLRTGDQSSNATVVSIR